MKYILMMNTMKAGQGVPSWPKKDLQAHIAFMMGLNKELRQSGELVSAEGLSFPDQAKLVRAGKDGRPDHRRRIPGDPRSFSPDSGLSMSTLRSEPMRLPPKRPRRRVPVGRR